MIVGVSVKFVNGVEIRLPKPNRHCDCFELAYERFGRGIKCTSSEHGQGFYTDEGLYLNRKNSMSHVRKIGQKLLPDWIDGAINKSDYLFSEDVW